MKVLLGADLLLSAKDSNQDFGSIAWLFQWLDQLKIQRCIDFPTLIIMSHFGGVDKRLLHSCKIIKKVIRKSPRINQLIDLFKKDIIFDYKKHESSINALVAQLAFVEAGEVDFLITDNEYLHTLSKNLNIDDKVYSLSEFLDKCSIENRELDQSKGLFVEETYMSNLNINDEFFDTFKKDYSEYYDWFKAKSCDFVFVSRHNDKVIALLKLKIEDNPIEYTDITPPFTRGRQLKISSFKIEPNRTKLAERFMRIIFNYAINHSVENIYVTFFDNYERKHRLKRLFEKWGFGAWGHKINSDELVLSRPFKKTVNYLHPTLSFPFHGSKKGVYLVYVDNTYSKALIGSYDNSTKLYDVEPYKNAISKVLILYNLDKPIETGAVILFVTDNLASKAREFVGAGIVDGVHPNFADETTFLRICRKRSIFADSRLRQCWKRQSDEKKISTIEFLYACALDNSTFSDENIMESGINLNCLYRQELKQISGAQFNTLVSGSTYERDFIAH